MTTEGFTFSDGYGHDAYMETADPSRRIQSEIFSVIKRLELYADEGLIGPDAARDVQERLEQVLWEASEL